MAGIRGIKLSQQLGDKSGIRNSAENSAAAFSRPRAVVSSASWSPLLPGMHRRAAIYAGLFGAGVSK